MNIRVFSIILVAALLLSSCNMPTNAPSVTDNSTEGEPSPTQEDTPPPPSPEPTATLLPSETPLPTNTPLPTATFTPTVPIAWPKDQNVNCRFGYGTEWAAVGALVAGQPATVTAKNSNETWWFVTLPNSTTCWVAASVTLTAGNLASLPVYGQSTASVVSVSIEKPDNVSVPGCIGPVQPISLAGSIEMNGPGEASWHFEVEQGGALAGDSTTFDTVGAKSVSSSFVPILTVGSYWVKLVVTSPNGKSAESNYKIECP